MYYYQKTGQQATAHKTKDAATAFGEEIPCIRVGLLVFRCTRRIAATNEEMGIQTGEERLNGVTWRYYYLYLKTLPLLLLLLLLVNHDSLVV
jgi:hypothetical protein